jgi:hypothetical protein
MKIKVRILSSLFFSLLLASGLEIVNTKDVFASSCEEIAMGNLIDDGQGEFNNKTVRVLTYGWPRGSCQQFLTSPEPQEFMIRLGFREGCLESFANCSEALYYLNDKKVNVIGEFSGSKEGYKIRDSSGKVFTLVIDRTHLGSN